MRPEFADELFNRIQFTRVHFYEGERGIEEFAGELGLPVFWDVDENTMNVFSENKWHVIPPGSHVSIENSVINTISPEMNRFYYTKSLNGVLRNIPITYTSTAFEELMDGNTVTLDGWTFSPVGKNGEEVIVKVHANSVSEYPSSLKLVVDGTWFKFK